MKEQIKEMLLDAIKTVRETDNKEVSFTVDGNFYGGITVSVKQKCGEDEGVKFDIQIDIVDNGIQKNQIAYSSIAPLAVESHNGGFCSRKLHTYEECSDELKYFELNYISFEISNSIETRKNAFVIGEKIVFFGKKFIIEDINYEKIMLLSGSERYVSEVFGEAGDFCSLFIRRDGENGISIFK
jgi:hypothetical protein